MNETAEVPSNRPRPSKCHRVQKVYFPDGEVGYESVQYWFHDPFSRVFETYEEAEACGNEWVDRPVLPPLSPEENGLVWEYRDTEEKVEELSSILDEWDTSDSNPPCKKEHVLDQFGAMCRYRAALEQRPDVQRLISMGYTKKGEL